MQHTHCPPGNCQNTIAIVQKETVMEYYLYQKKDKVLFFFTKYNFWFMTSKINAGRYINLINNSTDSEIEKYFEIVPMEINCNQSISLLEIEESKELEEKKINQIINVLKTQNNNLVIGLLLNSNHILEKQKFNIYKLYHINYIEIYMNNSDFSILHNSQEIISIADTIHLKNLILDEDIITKIKSEKMFQKKDIVIHIDIKEGWKEQLTLCANNNLFIAIDLVANLQNYYSFYFDFIDIVKTQDWQIDYKKYCSLFNYERDVTKRFIKKSCGLARDKIFINKSGKVYTCKDCSDRKCVPIGNYDNPAFIFEWEKNIRLLNIRNMNVDTFDECKKCEIRYLCGGQCRMMSFDKYGRIDKKSCYCEDEKKIYLGLIWNQVLNRI